MADIGVLDVGRVMHAAGLLVGPSAVQQCVDDERG
jgi:hypothetical protein